MPLPPELPLFSGFTLDTWQSTLRQLVSQSRFRISSFSPWFIMWGVLWIFGYLDTLWLPEPARNWAWPAVYLIGFVASFWPFLRRPGAPPAPELFRKLNWMSLILTGLLLRQVRNR